MITIIFVIKMQLIKNYKCLIIKKMILLGVQNATFLILKMNIVIE